MKNKQYVSSRSSYGKIGKLSDIESHNGRTMKVETLLINKIEEHNKNLSDKDRYFREITESDYKIMKNLSYSFGSNENQNLTKSFNEFYEEMEKIYKKQKRHLYKEKGNHIVEQVISLSQERAREILNQKDGDKLLLEYFKNSAIEINKKYGLEPIHIDVHLDEGKIDNIKNKMGVTETSLVKENIHAHAVFLNYNFSKQKTVLRGLKKQDFRDMQDLAGKVFQDLGFERGEDKRNSNRNHLKTTAYIEEVQNIENEKYVENQVNLNIEDMEYNIEDLKEIQDNKKEVIEEINELKEQKKDYKNIELNNQEIIELNTKILEFEKKIQDLKDSKKSVTELDISNEEKKKLHKLKQIEIKKYQGLRRDLKSEIKTLNKDYKTKMEDLKTLNNSITDKEKSLKKLENKEQKIKHIENLSKKELKKEHFKMFAPILSKLRDTPLMGKDTFIKEEIKPMLYKTMEEATETTLTLNDIKSLENDIKDLEKEHKEEVKNIRQDNEEEKQELKSLHKNEVSIIKSENDKLIQEHTKDKKALINENKGLKNQINEDYSKQHKVRIEQLKEVQIYKDNSQEKNIKIEDLNNKYKELEIDLTKEKDKSSNLEKDNKSMKDTIDLVEKNNPNLIKDLSNACAKCGKNPCQCNRISDVRI